MEKKPFYKRWWGIALIIWVAVVVVGIFVDPSEEEKAQEAAAAAEEKSKQAAEREAKLAEWAEQEKKKEAEKAAKEAAEAKADREKKAAKKAEIERITAEFKKASDGFVAESNGVVPAIDIEYDVNHFRVAVMVDEATWAGSSESQKLSFATTVGTKMKGALEPHEAFVYLISATNGDILAEQKLLGDGWKIKR